MSLSANGVIFDIKKFSLHDGPGIRTTIFLKGCPLNCMWCHNPEGIDSARQVMRWEQRCVACDTCVDLCAKHAIHPLQEVGYVTNRSRCILCGQCVEACPEDAREIIGKEVTSAQVMAEIEKDIIFYDESGGGATFSGGEPLLQSDFLNALLEACQGKDIHTAVDTTGFTVPAILDRVREHVNLFLYDLKLMDDQKHRQFTGVSNDLILSNLRWLSADGHEIIIRIPIVPGINDDLQNIVQTGEFISSLTQPHQVDILPYHNTGIDKYRRLENQRSLAELIPPSPEKMGEVADTLKGFGLQVTIGGQKHAYE